MCTAVAGGALGLVPRFSASRFWSEVRRCRATVITGLPAIARILWEQPVTDDERAATSHLRLGIFGPMTPELHHPLEERLGIRIADTYGMTEAEPLTVPGVRQPVGSCGVPAPDFEIRIAAEDGAALPPGERGEILARPRRRDVLFLGYEGDEEATRDAWRNGLVQNWRPRPPGPGRLGVLCRPAGPLHPAARRERERGGSCSA